jgi:hypothetical protein
MSISVQLTQSIRLSLELTVISVHLSYYYWAHSYFVAASSSAASNAAISGRPPRCAGSIIARPKGDSSSA